MKNFGEPEQIAKIKSEIEDIERMLSSKDENSRSDVGYFAHSSKRLDVDEVKKSLELKKKLLKEMTPTEFSPRKKNEAYAYAKKLKQKIIESMPTERYVTYPRAKDPADKSTEFEKAVQRHMEWARSGPKLVAYYNNIMKRIDPEHRWEDFNRYTKERA